jgi:hypothetical protein
MCVRVCLEFAGRAGAHCRTIARLATFLTIKRGIADNNQHGGILHGSAGGGALAVAPVPISPDKDVAQDQKRPWQALGPWIESASLC